MSYRRQYQSCPEQYFANVLGTSECSLNDVTISSTHFFVVLFYPSSLEAGRANKSAPSSASLSLGTLNMKYEVPHCTFVSSISAGGLACLYPGSWGARCTRPGALEGCSRDLLNLKGNSPWHLICGIQALFTVRTITAEAIALLSSFISISWR
ncbi:unnamed protein product [Discosporangium mesarthrocarpum]